MPFHLAAFSFSSTNTGAGNFVNVTAVNDSYLAKSPNNRYTLPGPINDQPNLDRIAASYAQGTTMTVARINSPSLREVSMPSITPTQPGLVVPSAFNVNMPGMYGPKIKQTEEFGVEADAAAVEVQTAALWLHNGVMNVPPQQIYTVQFSSAITTVANQWTSGTITLAQSLPPGEYEVVGMDCLGTTLIFARLIFAGATPRPGVLGRASLAIFPQNQFRNGNFGSFGRFVQYVQPQLEVFASSAAAITFTGWLDLIKVR